MCVSSIQTQAAGKSHQFQNMDMDKFNETEKII